MSNNREREEICLLDCLDNLIETLQRLPGSFEQEYELAKEFDLSDRKTVRNLFGKTLQDITFVSLFANSALQTFKNLYKDPLKETNSYNLIISFTSQEELYTCKISSVFAIPTEPIVERGATKREALVKALRRVADAVEEEGQ